MKIKKNTFSTLVLELFSPSIANCRKLKIQKNQKIDFPYCTVTAAYSLISWLEPGQNWFILSAEMDTNVKGWSYHSPIGHLIVSGALG
jgi:hypothetical protein